MDRVLIIGASARAAAASARRAGLEPWAVDLFADRDTQALCPWVERVPPDRYPHGLFAAARKFPPMPWLYTGGLENYPDLVAELAAERELWGNGPDELRRARDPLDLSAWLRGDGWRFAESAAAPGPGRWLRKPLRSGGGSGVRDTLLGDSDDPAAYHQRFAAGRPMSAVVATGDGHTCSPLALHAQLVGRPWLHAAPFAYCGNVSQGMPEGEQEAMAFEVGLAVAAGCGLRGVWGFDFIEGPDGFRTVVEINPRYTASVELAELARRGLALAWHRWGCEAAGEPDARGRPSPLVFGKAVYYAARPLTVPAAGPWDESLTRCRDVWRRPNFADIPHPGDRIDVGQPVVTLLADGRTEADVLATLKARAAELDRLFGVPTPEEPS